MRSIYGEEQFKIAFFGEITSVQPRSNVWRYLVDNRTHSLTGYNLLLKGRAEDEEKEFAVAISEKQQQKLLFHIGDVISGTGWTKKYPEIEYADYYRAGRFGKEITFRKVDDDHSTVAVDVAVSHQFFGWIFSLGREVKVVGPDEVVEQIKIAAEEFATNYQ